MNGHSRMSPLTALFLGISAVLLTSIAAAAAVGLYGLRIVDGKADRVFGLADQTVGGIPEIIESVTEGLPELVESLPMPSTTGGRRTTPATWRSPPTFARPGRTGG